MKHLLILSCVASAVLGHKVMTPRQHENEVLEMDHLVSDNPTVELRAVWFTTAFNYDWPSAGDFDTATQKTEMIRYLDAFADINLNTIFFQLRSEGDALYDSQIEPWSKLLKGKQGVPPEPYYDPLDFLIQEASKRNMQVHAWMNPYTANSQPNADDLAPNNIAKRYPQYAYPYGKALWMDPASTEVMDNIRAVIKDIIQRYDVAGVHWDDFFYPYPWSATGKSKEFPDNATYTRYLASGGKMARDDWRRDNCNRMVKAVYNDIKAHNPKLKFTISPSPLYRPGKPGGMPAIVQGFDPYTGIYADSKYWLQNGWVDALIPQLYFQVEALHQNYALLLDWWLSVNNASRIIYVGLAPFEAKAWGVEELVTQVRICRLPYNRKHLALGNSYFSARVFTNNFQNISTVLKETVYSTPATVPDSTWRVGV